MSQLVMILRNAIEAGHDPGPRHTCKPNAKGELCTYVTECAVLQAWRAEQAAATARKAA